MIRCFFIATGLCPNPPPPPGGVPSGASFAENENPAESEKAGFR